MDGGAHASGEECAQAPSKSRSTADHVSPGSAEAGHDVRGIPERKKRLKKVGNYVLGDVLGEGAYGQVREGLSIKEEDKGNKDAPKGNKDAPKFGLRVAVKIISRRLLRKVRNGEANLKREIHCIKLVKHKHVIQLYDVMDGEDLGKVYMVFELGKLTLQDLCEIQRWKKVECPLPPGTEEGSQVPEAIPASYARDLFSQLIAGLQACHSRGVVHRDIKPSNLQLTTDGILKIIDFGVAETLDQFSNLDDTDKFAGTPSFQPPEVAQGNTSFSATKVDIWAAGVTLYVMVTAQSPFKGNSVDELYSAISECQYEVPLELDTSLKDLISKVMKANPDERLSLHDIAAHQWCKKEGVPFSKLMSSAKDKLDAGKPTLLKRYLEEHSSDEEQDEEQDEESDVEEARVADAQNLAQKRGEPAYLKEHKAIRYERQKKDLLPLIDRCVIS